MDEKLAITMELPNDNNDNSKNDHLDPWKTDPRVRTVRLHVYGMICSSE
jgi:hypothetical protein